MIAATLVSLLMLGSAQEEEAPKVAMFDAFQVVEIALDGPNWRPWVQGMRPPHGLASMPSATVEVVESLERDRQLRLLEFRARTAPLLRTAFDVGHAFRTNVQMLAEMMMQDPSHPHPPSVPSVFYNNFKPPPENPVFKLQLATGWSRFWVGIKKEAGPGR